MFEKVYELPISMDYVKHWGMAEAVREIIQNALDSESPFEWEIDVSTLIIRSKFAKLEPKSLLLGTTTKSNDEDAIGSFGEGYKIALLVLTRLNYKVLIHNNDLLWTPEFRVSKKFEDNILCIVSKQSETKREGVTFEISGLSEDDIDQIKESCLYMQKDIGQVRSTSQGLIMFDKPNMLYIGGLFICKTSLEFGYNIKPKYLRLERDRQTVATFDLKYLIKDMWLETQDYQMLVELIERKCTDLEYIEYSAPEILKEACYNHFKKEYGDKAFIATSQKEMEAMIKDGLTRVIVLDGSYSAMARSSHSYRKVEKEFVKQLTIKEQLEVWLEANRKHMHRCAIVNFKKIIDESSNWKC